MILSSLTHHHHHSVSLVEELVCSSSVWTAVSSCFQKHEFIRFWIWSCLEYRKVATNNVQQLLIPKNTIIRKATLLIYLLPYLGLFFKLHADFCAKYGKFVFSAGKFVWTVVVGNEKDSLIQISTVWRCGSGYDEDEVPPIFYSLWVPPKSTLWYQYHYQFNPFTLVWRK